MSNGQRNLALVPSSHRNLDRMTDSLSRAFPLVAAHQFGRLLLAIDVSDEARNTGLPPVSSDRS
jgi:hypothetical protein